MKNYEPTPRQSLAIREFVSEAITPLIEDVLVKKLGQAMAFLKEQEQPKREWVGLTSDDVHDAFNYVEMVKLLDFDRDRPAWCEAFASACEARLKHRNGGNK